MNILQLLSLVASLLGAVQNPTVNDAMRQQALLLSSQAVQMAQYQAGVSGQITVDFSQNNLLYAPQLREATYTIHGQTIPLHGGGYTNPATLENISLMDSYTSFGDLNHDNYDDAIVILKSYKPGRPADKFYLAVVLNENRLLYNTQTLDLGTSFDITQHRILNSQFILDGRGTSSVFSHSRYELKNGKLVAVN